MRKLLFATAAVIGLGLSTANASPINYVQNGTFASPDVGGGWGVFGNGSVPGWSNTRNGDGLEIDYTPILGLPMYNGESQSLELNGSTFDTASQTISGLNVGEQYTLSWGYGNRPGSGSQAIQVFLNGLLVATDSSDVVAAGSWITDTVTVIADATSEVLSFAAVNTGGPSSTGNEIAGVSLTAASVPEPASLTLLGAGLIGLLGATRRRRPSAA